MRRALVPVGLIAVFSVPLWLRDPYVLHVCIVAGIFTIAAMSLNLLLGYTGQLSLGHVAFFGIGAYASALASLGFNISVFGYPVVHDPWPAWAGFLTAVAVAGLCGYLVGKLSFRVRGAYFVIVTVSFAEVVRMVALNWVDLTQGPLALTNIPPFAVSAGPVSFAFVTKASNYCVVLVTAVVGYCVVKRLVHSHIGRAMLALKENEQLAVSVGIDVTRYLVLAATISAGMAGAAGSLYAHYIHIIDPDIFLFIYTVTMVIMVVTGGKGTLAGPVVGGLIFGFTPELVRELAGPQVQWILYGALMILVVFLLPQGVVPAVQRLIAAWTTSPVARDLKPLAGASEVGGRS